jgi:DHA1 family tetracycline resistance protein-like MFS transporter
MTSMPHAQSRTPPQGAFVFIFITVVLDMVALGVMAPVLPKLVAEFKGGDIPAAATINALFAAAWAAMQFVFAPLLGAASDRFGRRPIILLSNLGLGLDYMFMALAPNLSWLFLGRLISGITSSTYPTALAYVTDITTPEQRAAKFGMLGAAFGIGFVAGPGISAMLIGIDLRLPFYAAAALSLVNTAYGFFVLRESLPSVRRAPVNWRKANPMGSLRLLRSHPELMTLSMATLLMYLAHEALPNMFILYSDYRYHWSDVFSSLALMMVGICSSVVQGGLVGRVVRRFGERACMVMGLTFGAVGFAMFGSANSGLFFLAGIPFVALWGMAGPAMQSLMSRRVLATEQGQLQGAVGSIRGMTGMIGPILMGGLFSQTAGPRALIEAPGAIYYLAAILVIATITIAWFATKQRATVMAA